MHRTRKHNAALKRLRLINERKAARRPPKAAPEPRAEPLTYHPGRPWTWLASQPLRYPKGVSCTGGDLCMCIRCLSDVSVLR